MILSSLLHYLYTINTQILDNITYIKTKKGCIMKKLIILLLMSFGISQANDMHQTYKNMQPKTRSFKSVQEFKHKNTKRPNKVLNGINPYMARQNRYHQDRYNNHYKNYHHKRHHTNHIYYPKHQRGYRHPKRNWFYAYRYTKADFVDRYGFYYGYFDRRGYMFEGDFYRYDRDYRYQDRLRGRGLFDRHLYYAPLPRIYRDDLYR